MQKFDWIIDKTKYDNEVTRLFPEAAAKKYRLFIRFDLFNISPGQVTSFVQIRMKNGASEVIAQRSSQLYKNKKYHSTCLIVNKKKCNTGITIIYDTYEELANIQSVFCSWDIDNNDGPRKQVNIWYDLNYEPQNNRCDYLIYSSEVSHLEYLINPSIENKIFNSEMLKEYDRVFQVMKIDNEIFTKINYGTSKQYETSISKDHISLNGKDATLEGYLNNTLYCSGENDMIIDCYYSKENVSPVNWNSDRY